MISRCFILTGMFIMATCAITQDRMFLRAEPAAQGKSFSVDVGASRVYIKVGSATRFGHPHGVEGLLKSGKNTFNASGEWVFDMATFTADTAEARRRVGLEHEKVSDSDAKKVTQSMRGPDVLDVARFPTAMFQITAITPLDHQTAGAPGNYQIDGKFTLHGTGQPIQFKAKADPIPQAGSLKLGGSFTIKQSDYGIKPYSIFGGVVKVTNELEITGDLLLTPVQ